jgi:hypothetical protein
MECQLSTQATPRSICPQANELVGKRKWLVRVVEYSWMMVREKRRDAKKRAQKNHDGYIRRNKSAGVESQAAVMTAKPNGKHDQRK